MRTQQRPRIGAYVKVVTPDRAQGLPFGLVGQVTAHSPTHEVVVRFPNGLVSVDHRTVRTLTAREIAQAHGVTAPRTVSI